MSEPLSYLDISDSVQKALSTNGPIVALESTIISHGLPYPQNLEVAKKLEEIILKRDATPATIAILNGRIKVGLSDQELAHMAQNGIEIPKASRRDLPFLIANKLDGATTVAATMIAAEKAGIQIFATGGIGGVHRGGEQNLDISADLEELSRTSVAVVSGGAKAILDLPKTLEYLETKGVPVIGYQTNEFPAFYSRNSAIPLDHRIDSPVEVANFLSTKWDLGLDGGVLIANPIPEQYSLNYDEMEFIIMEAIHRAESVNISGKDLTPFLLSEIKEITKGESLKANIELVYNNARLASEIARAYSMG